MNAANAHNATSMNNVKLVVTVPLSHVDHVRQALGDAGAGQQGNYSHCSFSSRGTGRYKGNEHSNPHIGQAGQYESAEEERIEVTVTQNKLKAVIAAMKQAHPYEEIAYDLYLLLDENTL
jgi:hypothetical protein